METLDCPKDLVGRVIGRGGETINDLQSRSQTRIQIDQTVPDGMPCKIMITGQPEPVAAAVAMVKEVMANGPASRSKPPGGPPRGMMPPGYGYSPPGGYPGYPPPGYPGYPPPAPVYAPPPSYYPPPGGGYNPQYPPPAGYAPPAGYPPPAGYAPPAGGYPPPYGYGYGGWQEHTSQDGNKYWHHAQTGVSQWERPSDA